MQHCLLNFEGLSISITRRRPDSEAYDYQISGADEARGVWDVQTLMHTHGRAFSLMMGESYTKSMYLLRGDQWYRLHRDRIGRVSGVPTPEEIQTSAIQAVNGRLIEKDRSWYLLMGEEKVKLGCDETLEVLKDYLTQVTPTIHRITVGEGFKELAQKHGTMAKQIHELSLPQLDAKGTWGILCGDEVIGYDGTTRYEFGTPRLVVFSDESYGYYEHVTLYSGFYVKLNAGWFRKVTEGEMERCTTPDVPYAHLLDHMHKLNGCLAEQDEGRWFALLPAERVFIGRYDINRHMEPAGGNLFRIKDVSFYPENGMTRGQLTYLVEVLRGR